MSGEDLQPFLDRRPFVPFRIYLTDGSTLDIRHPELFMIGRDSVVVGLAVDPGQRRYDRVTTIDLFHIMRAEALESATATRNS